MIMIANRIVRNKYKLIAAIIVLLIAVDSYRHKGLIRVMMPKKYPVYTLGKTFPKNDNRLINTNKNWVKAVNSVERMNNISTKASGLECDIYFDTVKNMFDVHHDIDDSRGLNFESLLKAYQNRNLQASLWIDFKNLNEITVKPALEKLIVLRDQYHLEDKILVESGRVDMLEKFSDSGFFTSYYVPLFNPYRMDDDSIKYWVDSLFPVIQRSHVNALSGYYFQYSFLHHYFPAYKILLWAPNDTFSLVSWLFKQKLNSAREVFIALYP